LAVASDLPGFNVLYQLPGLQTQIPGRTAYLFIFCMAALAGLGFDTALDIARRRPVLWTGLSAFMLCGGLLVTYVLLKEHGQTVSDHDFYRLQTTALREAGLIGIATLLWLVAAWVL